MSKKDYSKLKSYRGTTVRFTPQIFLDEQAGSVEEFKNGIIKALGLGRIEQHIKENSLVGVDISCELEEGGGYYESCSKFVIEVSGYQKLTPKEIKLKRESDGRRSAKKAAALENWERSELKRLKETYPDG